MPVTGDFLSGSAPFCQPRSQQPGFPIRRAVLLQTKFFLQPPYRLFGSLLIASVYWRPFQFRILFCDPAQPLLQQLNRCTAAARMQRAARPIIHSRPSRGLRAVALKHPQIARERSVACRVHNPVGRQSCKRLILLYCGMGPTVKMSVRFQRQ